MRPKLAAAVAEEYADVVVGIKTAHYWAMRPFDAEHLPWTAVDRALEAGELCGLPIMVDFCPWLPERPYPTLLEKMRPGDIHTHVFAQQFPIIDAEREVYDHLWKARERGIIFDVGHGAASFWFRNAVPAIEQGFVPDSISTDLHTGNLNGPVIDMIERMNKILNIGVPLCDVIAKSTIAPAREIGHPGAGHPHGRSGRRRRRARPDRGRLRLRRLRPGDDLRHPAALLRDDLPRRRSRLEPERPRPRPLEAGPNRPRVLMQNPLSRDAGEGYRC